MTTRQLYYLVTIADQGSLSGASRVLGISQPALSKFLSEYESSLGFLLFLRYHRQLTPTAVGRYVIDAAQKILDEQTRMLQSMRADYRFRSYLNPAGYRTEPGGYYLQSGL